MALVRRRSPLHRPLSFAVALAAIAVAISVTMAEAALVAAEGPVVASALEAALVARRLMVLRHRGMRGLEAFVEQVLTLLVAELVADVAGLAQPLAVAIGQLARLLQLLAIGHDDAIVMLCVLQIVLAQHRVAR